MTDAEALDFVVARTGHTKLREQVETDPAYWLVVREFARAMSAMPRTERPTVHAHHAAERMAMSCLYRERCGCDFPTCHAGQGDFDGGTKASRERCVMCLKSAWSLA